MDDLKIKATKFTPEISFDSKNHILEIRGKSYPENCAEFYEPIFSWVNNYLSEITNEKIIINIELLYFNSSSSKALMNFFDMLEEADNIKNINVNWIYNSEDDIMLEYGEEFKEDMQTLILNLIPK
ncbi:MAG: DUF1987 domain-containing protein [Desulfobacterales bacterium]|nr:DUF1987 domain-containing protein [Desulfobacterales bacterium]